MKRNQGVARRLLETVEQHADSNGMDHFHLITLSSQFGDTQEDWQYASRLLVGSGFLTVEAGMVQLTWNGHELLGDLVNRQV
ncbi:GNAT family N-acetyltransferase [Pseudomonas fortuita]|uniref:hypothetical protein n=1 Tax=Pseudomonas fortuita TaxID=3233375 RepID=UPI003D8151C3